MQQGNFINVVLLLHVSGIIARPM